jgi:hypothetical protein
VQSAGSGTPPPYFFNLVKKIKNLGDDIPATTDKTVAKKYKDYVMEEDFSGNITITRKGDMDAPGYEEVYMSYSVDEVPLRGKKGSTKVEEYEEVTARPDGDGKMKDVEDGVPDDVIEEGTMFEDNMAEFGKTKKADGGRIGYKNGLGVLSLGDRGFLMKPSGKGPSPYMLEGFQKGPKLSEEQLKELLRKIKEKDFKIKDPIQLMKASGGVAKLLGE